MQANSHLMIIILVRLAAKAQAARAASIARARLPARCRRHLCRRGLPARPAFAQHPQEIAARERERASCDCFLFLLNGLAVCGKATRPQVFLMRDVKKKLVWLYKHDRRVVLIETDTRSLVCSGFAMRLWAWCQGYMSVLSFAAQTFGSH
jgi:hypothetical protein